jgi:hypothetical protein
MPHAQNDDRIVADPENNAIDLSPAQSKEALTNALFEKVAIRSERTALRRASERIDGGVNYQIPLRRLHC